MNTKTKVKKGDKVKVTNNEIFDCMGFKEVTGEVFSLHGDDSGFSIRCDQTKCIEGVSYGDGQISVLG